MDARKWVDHGARLAHHSAISDALPAQGVVTLLLKSGEKVVGQISGVKTDTRENGLGKHQSCGAVRIETSDATYTFDFQEIETVTV